RRHRHRRVPLLVSGHRLHARAGRRESGHGDGRGDHDDPRRRLHPREPAVGHRDGSAHTEVANADGHLMPHRSWISRWQRRLPALTPSAWVGVVMVAIPVFIAIFGPALSPHAPDEIFGTAFASPSSGHPLGLDFVGRDVLSRFLNGGRTAILVAL